MYTGQDWQRLGDMIRAELQERGWTQADLAEAAGVSGMTISTLINGHERGRIPTTLPKVETALGWPIGASRVLLNGGVLAFEAFRNRQYASAELANNQYGPALLAENLTMTDAPRTVRAREVADLVRRIESLRDAVERLPLAAADRSRFLATLAEYETELTDVLDRPAVEDAG